jgi:hypothetical protein
MAGAGGVAIARAHAPGVIEAQGGAFRQDVTSVSRWLLEGAWDGRVAHILGVCNRQSVRRVHFRKNRQARSQSPRPSPRCVGNIREVICANWNHVLVGRSPREKRHEAIYRLARVTINRRIISPVRTDRCI